MGSADSPVAKKLRDETRARYGGTLGYIHYTGDDCNVASSHHAWPCRQESPVDGVSYDPSFAHAWEWWHGGSAGRYEATNLWLSDPRTRYIVRDGWVRFGDAVGGGRGQHVGGHTHNYHWSGMPGYTFDTRSFYDPPLSQEAARMWKIKVTDDSPVTYHHFDGVNPPVLLPQGSGVGSITNKFGAELVSLTRAEFDKFVQYLLNSLDARFIHGMDAWEATQ